jgi:RNA polymerase sigma-70 factor (ECF subfamily)
MEPCPHHTHEPNSPALSPSPPSTPDTHLTTLVTRIASGDESALKSLFDFLSPRVLGLTLQILRDHSAAEEALIDVFSQVWRQASRYEPDKGSVATWITTLARTRAIDLRRQRQRHSTRESPLDTAELDLFQTPDDTPITRAEHTDLAHVIQRALIRLPHDQRRAVEAAFFGGLSHTEIAAALNQPLGTIKTRIRSGLAALRTALASAEGEVA